MTDFKGAMLGKSSSFPEKWVVSPTHIRVFEEPQVTVTPSMAQSQEEGEEEIDVNLSEVYFLIMHFLSSGPCSRATGQLWNELLQHKLLPRRYHAWYSRTGLRSGDEDDDGMSFPLSYIQVLERNADIQKDHLVKLLQRQLMACRRSAAALEPRNSKIPTAADVPTLLGLGSFSLLCSEPNRGQDSLLRSQLRWPHGKSGQVRGLALREVGGGFAKHHRSPSIRAASYAILKPSVLVDKIQIIKKFRGHRNAVYCAIFDKTGQHIITGSDDRLVKIWSTETGFCLRSCRGHEGDITELSVSSGSTLVASASNDYTIRVWRLPDGVPVSVLRGHRGAVTAIAFSPRQSCEHHLLSSSDDGTCRIWDARDSALNPRVYIPNPELLNASAKSNLATQPVAQQPAIQISCCAFNADGSIFVTGSSDKFARVWDARKWNDEITGKPNYEMDILKGHENAVNYVQFCGCAGTVKPLESMKEDRITKFKNVWLAPDSIVTCSRDGSAIIWICKPRRKNARYTHWSKAYHLRVPPPPMPPHPPRVGGPRQRLLPTPRGVNMIVWSLDNRFVLAAIMDCRICVWNAVDGSLVHSLTGHTKSTFVVDVHPFNPRIAMSAGYDGRVIIWDIWEGQPVRVYETGDFQIVDGCFSPDGTSLVVSDEVGQFYLLGTGQGQSQKDAKYDQFFLGDFRPLVHDIQGNVLDQETQLPPHQRNIQDLLCDANMIPYKEPYQSMYQQRRLGALGMDWKPLRVNLAVGTDDVNYLAYRDHPFVVQPNIPHSPVDAPEDGARRWVEQPRDVDEEMDWDQDASRPSDDSGSDYSVSEESLSLLDEDEGTASSTEGMGQSHEEVDDVEESEREISIRRSIRYKRRAEGTASDFLERKARKLAANLQMVEESDNNNVEQTPMQEQADRVIPAMRDGKYHRVTRPKRAAATNAMQMLSHIHSKEDGDEEDASSSHDETSCYNTEEEAESDGPPASLPLSSDHKECEQAQQAQDMEAEGREECSESSERDVEGEKDVTVLKHINEDLGCQTNIEKAMATTNVESKTQHGHVSPDDVERKTENHKESEVGSKVLFLEQCNSEIRGNTLRPIDSSGPPLSQRRLVVKLRSNKVGLPSKAGFEDMAYAGESADSKGAHASIDEDGNKQKLTRCILNLADSATLFQDSHRGVSGTGDNGTYNPIQSTTLKSFNYEEAQPPARDQKKQKMKGQSVPDRVSKKAKVHEPASMNPTGSSSSRSDSRSCGAYLDPSGKAAHRACSNVIRDTSDYETEVDSGGLDWVRKLESRPTNLDFSQTEVATVSRTQRLSFSPESFATCHPWEEKDSTVNDNPCEDWASQNDKPITGSRSGPKRNGAEMSLRRVDAGGRKLHTSKLSNRVSVDESQQDWKSSGSSSDATDTEDGPLSCRKSRTKAPCKISNVMHEQDNFQFLQGSEEDHSGSQSLKNSAHLFCKRSSSESEEFESDERDGSYGVQTTVAEVDEIRQHFSEGHTESDPYHDGMKWTESEIFGGHSDAQYSKHRRTLGEIEPTNLSVEGSEDSPGNSKVRRMQSVMSEGIKARKLKGNRGRRTTILRKENKGEGKAGRQVGWSNRYLNHHKEGMEEGTGILPDKGNWHDNQHARRPKGRAFGKSEQAGEPVWMEKRDLKMSNRSRREISRKSERDQGRPSDVNATMGDKGTRTRESLFWLLLSEMEEGTPFIPQFGDEVAYLRQGHAEYLDAYKLDELGPWTMYGEALHHVEFCQVVGLEYAIVSNSGETCCKCTLEFLGNTSGLQGKAFSLTLPELTNFPDFIVEKTRYDASIERQWTTRDRCKVWWKSQHGEGGEWWEGRVVNVKPKSVHFPGSPWERFMVQYKTDPTKKSYCHSPWELFDLSDTRWEHPCIHQDTREHLLFMLESAVNEPEDAFGLRRLKQISGKSDFCNRLPVPLTLEILMQRLQKDYYHSTQAFDFDIQLLLSNAELFCGSQHPVTHGLHAFAREVRTELFREPSDY